MVHWYQVLAEAAHQVVQWRQVLAPAHPVVQWHQVLAEAHPVVLWHKVCRKLYQLNIFYLLAILTHLPGPL